MRGLIAPAFAAVMILVMLAMEVHAVNVEFNVSHGGVSKTKGTMLQLWTVKGVECPKPDWFSASLASLPTRGTLFVRDPATKTEVAVTEKNMEKYAGKFGRVVYKPMTVAPAGVAFPVKDSFLLKGFPADRCSPSSTNKDDLQVNINIINHEPKAFNANYKVFNGSPRQIKLKFWDRDGIDDVKSVTIQEVSGGCTVAKVPDHMGAEESSPTGGNGTQAPAPSNTPVTSFPAEFAVPTSHTHRQPWRYHNVFEVKPPADKLKAWQEGTDSTLTCKLSYFVTDGHSLKSNMAVIDIAPHSMDTRHLEAYDAEYTARPGRDNFIQVSLRTSAEGGLRDRYFYVDELPAVGKLYVRGHGGTFDAYHPNEVNATGLIPNLGRQRRAAARLYYTPPKEAPKGADATVVLKWHMVIGTPEGTAAKPTVIPDSQKTRIATIRIVLVSSANQTGPVCGLTTLDPVFHERPFIKIPWNYSLPDGSDVSRIVLYSVPKNPIGDFYATDNQFSLPQDGNFQQNLKPLKFGEFFNDRKQQTFFKMRPASEFPGGKYPLGIQQWFRIRVMNYRRQSCVGLVRVIYRKHDDKAAEDVNKTISYKTTGVAIRNEVAYNGKYNLLPLRGLANQSLQANAWISGVVLHELPKQGTLYSLTDGSPLLEKMYGTYCRKVDCASLVQERLVVGKRLGRTKFDGDKESQWGVELLRLLYRANANLSPQELAAGDSFSYYFIGANNSNAPRKLDDGEQSTWLQKVNIVIRNDYNPVLYFTYDKPKMVSPESDGKKPAAVAQQVYAAFRISNASSSTDGEVVEVLQKNDFKHHFIKKKRFRLYQLKTMDGHRAVPGNEIAPSTQTWDPTNTPRRWLTDPQSLNRLVFAPSLQTHRQRFSFRVRIYPLKGATIADIKNYTEYRVRVARNNNPPVWDTEEPCNPKTGLRVNCFNLKNNTVKAGEEYPMFFSVVDLDEDAISFVVPKIPRYGRLEYIYESPGGQTRKSVHAGNHIRLGKSTTQFKGLVQLVYKHVLNTARFDQYPLTDHFQIYGDDGAAKTPVKEVSLSVINDGSRRKSTDKRKQRVKDSVAVGIAVLVMLSALIAAAVVIVKRRQSLKRRYMALPVVTTNQATAAAANSGSEMKPVPSV